tara:strand:- start:156 stop:425 length:270 start_codon:yes stop_codon:yes gene_type:complete
MGNLIGIPVLALNKHGLAFPMKHEVYPAIETVCVLGGTNMLDPKAFIPVVRCEQAFEILPSCLRQTVFPGRSISLQSPTHFITPAYFYL